MYKYVYNTLSVLFCKNKEKPTTFQREFGGARKKATPQVLEGASFAAHPREVIYEKTAHVIIDTDGLSPDEVADEIIISAL